MELQIDVKVTKRDKTHEKGLFKKGAVMTIDLDDMVVYHSGVEWRVIGFDGGYTLAGFETYFEVID